MSQLVFVYGTLTRSWLQQQSVSQPASALLSRIYERLQNHAQWLGAASTRGTLYQVAHYPGLTVSLSAGRVYGELYEIGLDQVDELMDLLDQYEECHWQQPLPHEYRRERILVERQGQAVSAWAYIYNRAVDGLSKIESGRFN